MRILKYIIAALAAAGIIAVAGPAVACPTDPPPPPPTPSPDPTADNGHNWGN